MTNSEGRFVLTVPLKTTPRDEKILLSRLEAARQVYNACLGECFKRYQLLRESRAYRKASKMSKRTKKQKKARNDAFQDAEKQLSKRGFGLSQYDIYAYTKQFNRSWLSKHLDSQVNRTLAKRALDAVNRWRFGVNKPCKNGSKCPKPVEKRNCATCCKPSFKPKGTILTSVEGTNNRQSIHWDDGKLIWNTNRGRFKFQLDAMIDEDDPVVAHALDCPIKYVRVVRREIRGRHCFYAQLILVGKPYQRHPLGEGEVGLDLGPSTIAIVTESGAVELVRFCDKLEDGQAEIRRLQRKLDRQRRANNPNHFNADGTAKRGRRSWHESNRMKGTRTKLTELHRQQAEYRKTLHGELVNNILELGNVIKLEKLSYKAWQRNRRYSKSSRFRAPGMFVALLKKRASILGARVIEFGTYETKFSQLDHTTGEFHPELANLSVRYKTLGDGTHVQRDLYSAFLALCYDPEINSLNADLARKRWSGEGSRQRMAFRELLREDKR